MTYTTTDRHFLHILKREFPELTWHGSEGTYRTVASTTLKLDISIWATEPGKKIQGYISCGEKTLYGISSEKTVEQITEEITQSQRIHNNIDHTNLDGYRELNQLLDQIRTWLQEGIKELQQTQSSCNDT